jgi:Sulfotransferase family
MDRLASAVLNGSVQSPDVADPVFVLCMGRSGSTLLRFLLDAHPELACPPETSLPALCAQLAVVWSLIEGAPLSGNRGDDCGVPKPCHGL